MRYAIFGDIHGNLDALEAMIQEVDKEQIDRYLCVGDIVGYGASPSECIKAVRDLDCLVVAGNHDRAVTGQVGLEYFNTFAQHAVIWTQEVISEKERKYLGSLNLIERMDEITLVHSSLNSPELFEYIQTSFDAHLSFLRQTTPLVFIGHSHIPVNFVLGRTVSFNMDTEIALEPRYKYMINVGSVGQPRDENPDAACVILDTKERMIKIKRYKYDVYRAAERIKEAGLPQVLADRLFYGR
jgi:predicted phosphodiesterase